MPRALFLSAALLLSACGGILYNASGEKQMSNITKDIFGTTDDGRAVERYILTNANGLTAHLITYGATLTQLHVKDRQAQLADIVLGFDTLAQYQKESPYFGCTTGRVANRIAQGHFSLNGVDYQLAVNNDPNHLHGGLKGLDKVVWQAEPLDGDSGPSVRFTYLSPDGEEGYPGNLSVAVTYTLTNDDELSLTYQATTDAPTPVNLTNHSYFNLSGGATDHILNHVLTLNATRYTEPDETLIPTGRILPVAGTPLDFTGATAVGARIDQVGVGYDHNFVLDKLEGQRLSLAAEVYDPQSGRVMQVLTTEPGVQFYTGNYLDNLKGKGGAIYKQHGALCLETQHFPDSVNQPKFPTTILEPGQTYRQTTIHRFSTR